MTSEASSVVARLERLPITRWHVRARLIMGTATFFDGYNVLAIAYTLPVLIRVFHMTPLAIGPMISASFAGQLIGALVFGWLAERHGRLRIATLTIATYGLMGFACALAWDAPSLGIFRFLQGIGLGGEVPIAAAYINEFAKAERRGRFFILYELSFSFGLLLVAILGYFLVPAIGWRALFFIGGIPTVPVIFLRRLLPESPRWLVEHGRIDEADKIISTIERDAIEQGIVLPEPETGMKLPPRSTGGRWRELVSGIYLKRSLLVWTYWSCSYLIGYGLTTWLPTLYRTVFALSLSTALGYGLITSIVAMGGTIACAMLIDKVGRRFWYNLAFFGGAVPLIILWALGASSAMQVVFLATASFVFIGTINISILVYAAELYPTRIRALGVSVGSAWLRAASAIGPILVGLVLAHGSISWVFAMFALVALIGGLVNLCFGVETTGQVLEKLSP
jgi:MFS transporter, putative metabolite:H+ symporter